jgi:uncharacterized tellurite resistance protein B-like protein
VFRRQSAQEHAALAAAVRQAFPDADQPTVEIVGACAGLLATVAYADRQFSIPERERIRALLTTVQGLSDPGRQAILQVLDEHVVELATVESTRFARSLREHAAHDLRKHLLSMLVEVAAADEHITQSEVTVLRRLTQALGLDQRDYNDAQAAHEHRLGTINK